MPKDNAIITRLSVQTLSGRLSSAHATHSPTAVPRMRCICRLHAARRLAPWMIARQLTGTQYGRCSCSSSATSNEMPTNRPMMTES
ncbi:hypothetical protein D3C75_1167150 [compost metagenome]